MSRGYPDFSGATAFPVRKHFRVDSPLVGVIGTLDTETEYLISGQALIDGGYIHFVGVFDIWTSRITLTIDGNALGPYSVEYLSMYCLGKERTFPLTLLYLDRDMFTVTIGLVPGYYCGTEYKLEVWNATADNLAVSGHLAYSDVT